MKLKRCPNSHYYDGDKYEQCPHCSAVKAPAPAPKPVIEPAPQPKTDEPAAEKKPVTVPAAKPEPILQAPVKADDKPENIDPAPAVPVTEKKASFVENVSKESSPVKEETWRCSCGSVNSGKFCFECGSPRPEPKKEEKQDNGWKCICGAENKGKFCFQCGTPRPQTTPEKNAPVQEKPLPVHNMPDPEISASVNKTEIPVHTQAPAVKDRSLTEQISESSFTGNIEDARKKAAPPDDEGVTQILFDDINDGFVLAWLTVTNTSSKGKVFTITTPKCTVGRGDAEHIADIDLHNDRSISRGVQAIIVYDPLNKKFFLQNAEGKTYAYVNKEMVLTYKELNPYDIIMLGQTKMVFVPLCSDRFSW